MFTEYSKGGELSQEEKQETYKKWKDLVNMSASELKKFMDSDEGKEAGLSKQEADKLGIHYGRESAKWILKMKDTPNSEWTPEMWRWAKRQISFNSRMRGNKGKLYDDKGRKTRKHLSLLIWGHNPEKYEMGGGVHKLKEALKIQQEGSFKDKIEFVKENPEVFMGKFADGGELTLTSEQVEKKLGRKLHWWNDDVVLINGIEYKKVFLKSEYKRLYALGGELNEDLDLSKDFAIRNLFYKYEKQYENEYNEDNWIKFHYGSERKGGVKALKESLELIGDGEITDKGDKHFMYKEMLKNDTLILVVHASLKKSPYGGMEGYKYSLGVYRNNPRTQQIGGGYGASGIMSIEHTRLLSYDDYDIVHHNRNIISKVCSDIKKYAEKYF